MPQWESSTTTWPDSIPPITMPSLMCTIARASVPEAEQGKGYGMPALVYRGKPLISVMRAKKHIGVYPFSPAAVSAVAQELPESDVAKGTIRFQPDRPLSDDVVRTLVASRAGRRSTADTSAVWRIRAAQPVSTRLAPRATITTAMMPSRIRHARDVDSQRLRKRAPNARPKNHATLAIIAPAANSQRS